jgi:hypothetical protein
VDLWALGVTLAEFFRPLRISFEDEQADDSDEERPATKSEDPPQRFVTPPGIEPRADADWARVALFDADNGEIALVWSIFQVRGTPTEATWPVCVAQFDSHAARLTLCRTRRASSTSQTRGGSSFVRQRPYGYAIVFRIFLRWCSRP